jgi:hypothetical protein
MLPMDWAKVMKKRHVYVQVKSATFLQKKKHAEHKQTILPRISDAILRVLHSGGLQAYPQTLD